MKSEHELITLKLKTEKDEKVILELLKRVNEINKQKRDKNDPQKNQNRLLRLRIKYQNSWRRSMADNEKKQQEYNRAVYDNKRWMLVLALAGNNSVCDLDHCQFESNAANVIKQADAILKELGIKED